MKQIHGRAFAKMITRKGWHLNRAKGSHHVYTKQGRDERIVIPMHGAKPLKIGLLRSLMKIADIQENEL